MTTNTYQLRAQQVPGTYYCHVKNRIINESTTAALEMVCAPAVGLHVCMYVPSCCRSPSLPPHRLSTIGSLLRTCFLCHPLPVGTRPLPTNAHNKQIPVLWMVFGSTPTLPSLCLPSSPNRTQYSLLIDGLVCFSPNPS